MNPFAELHKGPDVLILPNAWDAGSARVIELAGAKAIATSSAAVAWSHGFPDGEALPFDVLMNTVREIRRVVEVPITADIEAGYADEDEDTVADNVEYLIDAGASGINIEDGKGAPEALCDKIAAIKEQHGDEIWVNARTDVYLHSLATGEAAYEETVRRAQMYRKAGADSIFVPFAGEDALLVRLVAAITKELGVPLNAIAMPGIPNAARLKEIGVRRLSAGTGIAKVSLNRTFELAQAFLTEGNSEPLAVPSLIPKGLNAVMRGN